MKKRRGLRRYYRNLAKQNYFDKSGAIDFSNPKNWFDLWHLHFDWRGYGNNSFKRRKPHLYKLFRHFELFAVRTKEFTMSFQLYAIIFDIDSYSDALYLHTPNPNNTPFPYAIPDLQKTSTFTNKKLDEYINNLTGYEKLYGQAGEAFCLIYKKEVGVPFE